MSDMHHPSIVHEFFTCGLEGIEVHAALETRHARTVRLVAPTSRQWLGRILISLGARLAGSSPHIIPAPEYTPATSRLPG